MATLLIAYLIKKNREKKRRKKANDDARYRQLEAETSERLRRTESGRVVIENDLDDEEDGKRGDALVSGDGKDLQPPPPPGYYHEAGNADADAAVGDDGGLASGPRHGVGVPGGKVGAAAPG